MSSVFGHLKRHPIIYGLLLIVIGLLVFVYIRSLTPYGRMDYRAAFSQTLLSFDHTVKPDPDVDFELSGPVNLFYALSMALPDEDVARVEDVSFPGLGDDPAVKGRLYWPEGYEEGDAPLPFIIYYHGGGFAVGSVDIFDDVTRSLANATDSIVLSVDYRLAPVSPYPDGINDAYAGLLWAAKNASRLGADPDRLMVGGDSAGGNFAAVISLRARDENGPKLAGQLLYYPVVDLSGKIYPSAEKFAEGFGSSKKQGAAFQKAYLSHVKDRRDPYISPYYAKSLAGLPPALVITAEFDTLADQGRIYAERLKDSGVSTTFREYDGIVHGFMSIRFYTQRQDALELTDRFIKELPAAKQDGDGDAHASEQPKDADS